MSFLLNQPENSKFVLFLSSKEKKKRKLIIESDTERIDSNQIEAKMKKRKSSMRNDRFFLSFGYFHRFSSFKIGSCAKTLRHYAKTRRLHFLFAQRQNDQW